MAIRAFQQQYTIRKRIQKDIYDGTWVSEGVVTEVTIRRFRTMKADVSYLRDLRLANGKPGVAIGYTGVVDEEYGGGLVFTERLQSFDPWLKDKRKKMWLEDYKGKNTMGFGLDAQTTFHEIGMGMESINSLGIVHDNLVELFE